MPKILYIEHNGKEHVVDADVGKSVMQNALENLVPGIIGDCGGACSCATCHGYIDPAWEGKAGSRNENEEMMLDGALRVEPNSRLTCQVIMTQELDGLVVRLPESQF
ncbi:2Fe-2S iron-sulfur cluster-binding protein [Stenotrophobium rhamnosiphilum]|uniref:(2Fe-2S)-binding protein n=1 Tax=Stenotrophobium rhamnosiphilum TaxID=2029166 RepID=A0A2T5MD38_9GAMM|nr:2Fe-2S iron-sulfur cluster-binding protein [Stenotrophobium rhamnosiphilum]PTU30493.1 (2Fe-2S)-binding protein [Stenotrophobium rhamnosiphilum]